MKKISLVFILLTCFFSVYAQNAETNSNRVKRFYYNDSIPAIDKWFNASNGLDSLKTYYKSGELNEAFYFLNNMSHGQCFQYNKKGEKLTTWEFENGTLKKRKDHKFDYNKKNENRVRSLHERLEGFNKFLKKNPTDLNTLICRAQTREHLSNYTLALSDYSTIESYINSFGVTDSIPSKFLSSLYQSLGSIYADYEDENKALHYRFKALKTNQKDMVANYNFGAFLYSIREYRLALHYLDVVTAKWKKHGFSNWLLGALYTDFEEYEKALYHINIAFPKEDVISRFSSGKSEHDIRTIRGFLYHKLGRSNDGINDLLSALKLNSSNSFAYRHLGVIYYDLGDYKKSLQYLSRANTLGYEKTHDRYDLQPYLEFARKAKSVPILFKRILDKPYLSPNPVDDKVRLKNIDFTEFEYEIYDYKSELINKGVAKTTTLDVSNFPTGFYLLRVFVDGKVHDFELLKN